MLCKIIQAAVAPQVHFLVDISKRKNLIFVICLRLPAPFASAPLFSRSTSCEYPPWSPRPHCLDRRSSARLSGSRCKTSPAAAFWSEIEAVRGPCLHKTPTDVSVSLYLAQFCVAGDVRDAVPERGECCVDRLRSPSLLLVRPDPQLVSLVCSDRTHSVAREKYWLLQ